VSRSGPLTVGILFPVDWIGPPEVAESCLDQVRAVDPAIELLVAPYLESEELRTARSRPDAPDLRSEAPELGDDQRDLLSRSEVVLTLDLPYDVDQLAPRLRWVQGVGAGTGQLHTAGLAEAGIALTSNAGANSVGIAEFVIARILEWAKQLRSIDDAQRRRTWEPHYGRQVAGMTVGLIGLGAINTEVARRARAFGMQVVATRRRVDVGSDVVDRLVPQSELHEMLGAVDVVVSAVPETAETRGLIDEAALEAMRPGAFLVNVGRGSLVDEAALEQALRSGHLGGAALDVASVEPLPPESSLWDTPGLALSAHCSSVPSALFVNLFRAFAANLRRYLDGDPLENEVDLSRGY
jgi:phosphoglycerate dehydrogenase-like enzyme